MSWVCLPCISPTARSNVGEDEALRGEQSGASSARRERGEEESGGSRSIESERRRAAALPEEMSTLSRVVLAAFSKDMGRLFERGEGEGERRRREGGGEGREGGRGEGGRESLWAAKRAEATREGVTYS